ncbi:MAG: AAA family ATPase [Gemmatimonadales bacterium]
MPAVIRCRTLGPVDVSVDDDAAPAELLWRKNLALLLYLARSPKGSRARDHLIGLFWPDKPESAARHSLNEALRVLRRATGEGGIETHADHIRLAAGSVELDTERFEQLTAAGDWAAACELLGGEFLEGFSVPGVSDFEHWLSAERTLWRARAVDALTRQAEAQLGSGRATDAVGLARRALALDPHADVVIRTAMRALALSGDRVAASAAYEAFVARIAADVGGTPDAETRTLGERIARGSPGGGGAPRRRPDEPAPRGAESRRAPLVGREAELQRLARVWGDCRRDARAAVALVTGDAGTGKSRLADEARARAQLDGATAAVVRAVEADMSESWSGVFALARGGLLDVPGVAAAPAPALAAFAARVPDWAERFGSAVRHADMLPAGRALRDVLGAVTAEQPVLLVVDDAHWLDRDSLLALVAAIRDLATAPLCLLLTRALQPERPELDDLQSRAGRDMPGVALRLAPLSTEALRELARWALPHYRDEELDRVTRRIATDSAGLPLLAVELLHAVALGLDLDRTRPAWPRPLHTLDETLPGDLPEAVVGAIRVGFRRLSPAAQQVLAAVAVLHERVTPVEVGRATGLGAGEVAAALDELEWARWLIAEPRGYAFLARVVRDTVERDLITPGQRQRLRDMAS